MKRTSHTNLKDLRKIFFGLNTFNILKIYKKLDPLCKLKYRSGNNKKASAYESINIIIVRSIVMIYSLIINAFLILLFGVIPVSVLMHSVSDSTEKNNMLEAIIISVSALLLAIIIIIIKVTELSVISLLFILTWLILTHITAYLIVKKKYGKVSFELCTKE